MTRYYTMCDLNENIHAESEEKIKSYSQICRRDVCNFDCLVWSLREAPCTHKFLFEYTVKLTQFEPYIFPSK